MQRKNSKQRTSRYIVFMLLVSLVMQVLSVGNTMVKASATDTVQQIQDQMVADGIRYQEKKYIDYNGVADKKERAFIITADMNDPAVNIISSKAKDKVLKLETVSDQINREQFELKVLFYPTSERKCSSSRLDNFIDNRQLLIII